MGDRNAVTASPISNGASQNLTDDSSETVPLIDSTSAEVAVKQPSVRIHLSFAHNICFE